MSVNTIKHTAFLLFFLLILSVQNSFSWFDRTHLAVAKAAGYDRWYNAAGPDIARIKAGKVEDYNHYYNNNRNIPITPGVVLKQTERYNNPLDKDGHLYGAIIGSLREYVNRSGSGGFADQHLAFFVHYAADLSQPLHNMPYDNFNKSRHLINDGIVNREEVIAWLEKAGEVGGFGDWRPKYGRFSVKVK